MDYLAMISSSSCLIAVRLNLGISVGVVVLGVLAYIIPSTAFLLNTKLTCPWHCTRGKILPCVKPQSSAPAPLLVTQSLL